ncbi:MAG: carboxypeptidase regulatory-like domain-containing protein, partial [Bacteroidales bacterium]|nr:carboxypeptidase regulatory-like domain-containing protein [Bacteroidales bacterium]
MKKFLTFLCLIAAIGLSAQSYTETYYSNAGNPGGLNTDGDATTTGWTEVFPPSQSVNSWSSFVLLPFTFDFFETPVTRFKVSGNGLVTFDIAAPEPPADPNGTLPNAGLPDGTIAMFWDNFTTSPPTGSNDRAYWKVFGTAPNQQLWVRYHSFEYASYSFAYFAAVIEEGTNKVYIVDMNYRSGSGSATVGLQQNATNAVMQAGSPNIAFLAGGSANTDNDYWEYTPLIAGAPMPPTNPNPPSGTVNAPSTGTLTWDWGLDSDTYDLWIGPAGAMVQMVTGGTVTYPSGSYGYTVPPATDIEWQLIIYNSNKATTNGPVWTFQTACATVNTFPWVEAFENGGVIPNCWVQDPANTEDWLFRTTMSYAANADHTTGSGYFATIDDSSPYAAIPSGLVTPLIDVTGLGNPTLGFWYWIGAGNAGPSYIEVEVWDGGAWQNTGVTLTENVQWDEVVIPLTLYSNANLQVRFLAYENTANFNCDLAIDDVTIFDAVVGDLTGVVQDVSLNPIAGAVVTCAGINSAPTAADGIYIVPGILVGTYDVTCVAPAYNDELITGVVINMGTNTLDITMTAPTMVITPAVITVDVFEGGYTANSTITVTNNGNGPLDFFGTLTFLTEEAPNLSFEEVAAIPSSDPSIESAPTATVMKGGVDNKAMWDVAFAFDGNAGAQPGIETDGQYIYTSTWSAAYTTPFWFHQYDFNGNLIAEFDIAGATAVRDLAYDGTYFYGGAASNAIYVMDF